MESDEDYFSSSLWRRMEKYTNLDGPIHPYDPNLGQCHVWTGYKIYSGYGRIRCKSVHGKSRMILAHRAARVCALNAIPNTQNGRHTCDNRACVNPAHIVDGDMWENITDRELQGRNITKVGEHHKMSKLTYKDIDDIKNDYRSCRQIAISYKIKPTTIQTIKNGQSWKSSKSKDVCIKPSYGVDHYNSKLDEEKVFRIRNGNESCSYLAKIYGVSRDTIFAARKRKTWKHLP